MPESPTSSSRETEAQSSWRPPKRVGFFGMLTRLLVLLIIAVGLILPFTPLAGRIKRAIQEIVRDARGSQPPQVITKEVTREVPVEVVKEVVKTVEVPAPLPPLPSSFIERKEVNVASLFNGITVKTDLVTEQGTFASLERLDPDAYKAEFRLSIRVPKANQSLPELARINAHLPKALPGLEAMIPTAKISPFYHKLYDNKTRRVQTELTRLNSALDRHNFFDCETILELKHPVTERRVMLIQSEMDVVADGSDGDRMTSLDEYIYMSDYYQPFTSYGWAKTTKQPNPLLSKWEARLAKLNAEFAVKGLSAERNRQLKSSIDQTKAEIRDMKARSSLIAEKDPFIVISLLFRGYESQNPYTPKMGDYAAVIFGDKIYPAICGDYGPSFKMGEASLMMAKAISEKATPYRRPESDLKVTYLVFPGTADKPWGPPDLARWRAKCINFLNDMGGVGVGYDVHDWPDPFKKAVPPIETPVGVATEVPAVESPSEESPSVPAESGAKNEAETTSSPKSGT